MDACVICIWVRGDVTSQQSKIWATKLAKIAKNLATIKPEFSNECTHVVCSRTNTTSQFHSWAKDSKIDVTKLRFCSKDWIVESLKSQRLRDSKPFEFTLQSQNIGTSNSSEETVPSNGTLSNGLKPSQDSRPDSHTARNIREPEPESRHRSRSPSIASAVDSPAAPKRPRPARGSAEMPDEVKAKFACVASGTEAAEPHNANEHITSVLERLQHIYDVLNEDFRSKSYKVTIGLLSKLPLITEAKQVSNVHGIGQKTYEKIDEIIETGKRALLYVVTMFNHIEVDV
jgi:hypothetical protein